MAYCCTCHIQIIGKSEEDGPGIAGQVVAYSVDHAGEVHGVRGALYADHTGSSLHSRDLKPSAARFLDFICATK